MSVFIAQLHLVFRTEWNKKSGLLEPIIGSLPSLYANPSLVLPGLRLAAGLNLLAITKKEEKLASVFPPHQMVFDERTKIEVLEVLQRQQDFLREFCLSPPQTNEVARSGVLFCGLVHINAKRPIRLLELGCSAGLNLLCDQYTYPRLNYTGTEENVKINFKWEGSNVISEVASSSALSIVSRKGCDLNPLDLRADEQFRQILSYIWPDQRSRVDLFTAAVAALRHRHNALDLNKESAEVFLERELRERDPSTATVIMHSVFLQYPPAEVKGKIIQLIEQAGAAASSEAPLYWLRYEVEPVLDPTQEKSYRFILDLITFTGVTSKREVLAEVHPHGAHIRWLL